MNRKRTPSIGDDQQLPLPFNQNNEPPSFGSNQNNLVYFSKKLNEKSNVQDKESRQRSIDRLINYADKLKW